jgi:hypothetical protein
MARVDLKADKKILNDVLTEIKAMYDTLEKTEQEIKKAGISKSKEEESLDRLKKIENALENKVDAILSVTEAFKSK